MQLDDALHERQPDSQTALGALERLIRLREQIKHPGQKVRRNTYAVVAHAQLDTAASCLSTHVDVPSLGSVFGSVVENIGEHLDEACQVSEDADRLFWHRDGETVTSGIDRWTTRLDGLRDDCH